MVLSNKPWVVAGATFKNSVQFLWYKYNLVSVQRSRAIIQGMLATYSSCTSLLELCYYKAGFVQDNSISTIVAAR
jgi:hypothetical protein